MRRLAVALLGPVLLSGACVYPNHDPWRPPQDLPGSYAPDDVVLRVREVGGPDPSAVQLTRLPTVTFYGDGRVITEGPVSDGVPAPALPSVLIRTIEPESVRNLAENAMVFGVGTDIDLGAPNVDGERWTQFTLLTADGLVTTLVHELGVNDGLSQEQADARTMLAEFRDMLLDLKTTLAPRRIEPARPYDIRALVAVTLLWFDPQLPELPNPPELAWPGPELPGRGAVGGFVTGDPLPDLGCVTVSGPALEEVLALAETATVATPWSWAGQRYFIRFRPLLPEEATCDDI